MRRVFGIQGAGVRASIIAEHVLNVQFNYTLIIKDDADGRCDAEPNHWHSPRLTNSWQFGKLKLRLPSKHHMPLQNGSQPQLTMTTSTSVRNMQFRKAL